MSNLNASLRLRTAFISDLHLGTKECRADLLLDFLGSIQVETLVLVGDVIDIQAMRASVFWPQSHNNMIRAILDKARRGTRVIYIPGNHDEVFRELAGSVFGNLELHHEYLHEPPTDAGCWCCTAMSSIASSSAVPG